MEGRIRLVRTPGGQRRVPESEIKRLLRLREEQPRYGARVIIYARVSSYRQRDRGDLLPSPPPLEFEGELVEDFIEIVKSFTARIYGKRSHKAKKLLEAVMNELKGD